jgi:hypothetical protein
MTQTRRVDGPPAQPFVAGGMNGQDEPRIRPINWPLVIAYAKLIAWHIGSKLVLGPIYLTVVAEGFRCVIPTLAVIVYGDEETGVDRAMLFAGILLVAVWLLWERALLLWLNDDTEFEASAWNPENHRNLIIILALVILGVDGCLFYLGVAQLGWGGGFSFTSLLATLAYVAVIVFVSYESITLRRRVFELKNGGE